jgi:thymidylate synthase (FAD)
MRVVKPQVIIEDDLGMLMPNGLTLAQHWAKKIELFARQCYKSEGKMTAESYKTFLQGLFQGKHHTGIAEHRMFSVTFVTDRGVSHEGLRHRMAAPYLFDEPGFQGLVEAGVDAWLQESTRYCDYTEEGEKAKGMTFILPPWFTPGSGGAWLRWLERKRKAEAAYNEARAEGLRPEQARDELPQSVKTQYTYSSNFGSWWNWCMKRTHESAHPQMRQLSIPVLRYLNQRFPMFFGSISFPDTDACCGRVLFRHKGAWYEEAKLIVRNYYDDVPLEEVYSD